MLNEIWIRPHCLRSVERFSKAWHKISSPWDFAKKNNINNFLFIIHANPYLNMILSFLFKYYCAILNNSPNVVLTIKYTIIINNKIKPLTHVKGPRTLKSRITNYLQVENVKKTYLYVYVQTFLHWNIFQKSDVSSNLLRVLLSLTKNKPYFRCDGTLKSYSKYQCLRS